jgi:hypothetical protein
MGAWGLGPHLHRPSVVADTETKGWISTPTSLGNNASFLLLSVRRVQLRCQTSGSEHLFFCGRHLPEISSTHAQTGPAFPLHIPAQTFISLPSGTQGVFLSSPGPSAFSPGLRRSFYSLLRETLKAASRGVCSVLPV